MLQAGDLRLANLVAARDRRVAAARERQHDADDDAAENALVQIIVRTRYLRPELQAEGFVRPLAALTVDQLLDVKLEIRRALTA